MNHFRIIRVLTLWCHYINFAKSKYLNSFESQLPAAKKQKWFIFAAAHFTKLCKILLKNSKCFHWYLLNGKINLKNSNGSEFSIKITVGFQISMHLKKSKITTILCIFGMIEISQKIKKFWTQHTMRNKLWKFCKNLRTFCLLVSKV